jgi:hypothetical protein
MRPSHRPQAPGGSPNKQPVLLAICAWSLLIRGSAPSSCRHTHKPPALRLSRVIRANATSISSGPSASTRTSWRSNARAAASISPSCKLDPGFCGLSNRKTGLILGTTSLSISNSLPPRSRAKLVVPVTFPPGLERLEIKPAPIGSAMPTMTIGIFVVAWRAALADGVPKHLDLELQAQQQPIYSSVPPIDIRF